MPDETVLQSKVPPAHAGKTLLDYLSDRFRYQTREKWNDLIVQRKVTVNGKPARANQVVGKSFRVAYSVVLKEPPVDSGIQVLYEEKAFAVAVKPGNLPSHADGNFIRNTFIHLITAKLGGPPGSVHLVHRLDRETSGLMVVAKDKKAHLNLVRQFERGTVEKEYLAVARGRMEAGNFEVKGFMGRDPSSSVSVRQRVVPEGTPHSKPSWTLFEKLRDLKDATLLRCVPKTGRTNQIRVHLDHLGHPVAGDKLYGKTDEEFLALVHRVKTGGNPMEEASTGIPRHLLHASKLSFDHPETGQRLTFEAPLPPDMREYIEKNG